MATFINRNISLMSGDGPHNSSSAAAMHSMHLRSNCTPGGAAAAVASANLTEPSPLQIFVKAKKKINDIFAEIESYSADAVQYIEGIAKQQPELITNDEVLTCQQFVAKVRGIRDVLCRDHMKVAFFGRTSNGKSTVINAMLRDKILPFGIGHTTNCFLQVEGSTANEPYLLLDQVDRAAGNSNNLNGGTTRCTVESVGQLASALSDEKLNESQMVYIHWPRHRCSLLRDDVVFVDSPGVDVTPNLDEWIDKYCLDADVFVLVANAESTLMVTEKNFFHKVSQRLSKPNIFILNNRWDASADAEFLDQVRKQHQDRAIDFLVNELKVCTHREAEERIFFISAKEALLTRLAEQGQTLNTSASSSSLSSGTTSMPHLTEGFQTRYFEFQDFERKFEECISQSAVRTKFEQHLQRGKSIANEFKTIFETIYQRTQQLRDNTMQSKKDITDQINFNEQQLIVITHEMKEKIHQMVEDVEQRVSKALNEEIRRLSVLVDEFNLPFHSDGIVINVYKRELHAHVERGLGSNLKARVSTALAMNMESSQQEMIKRMAVLLPDMIDAQQSLIMPRREPFEILYRLNCDNLCADFQEDLEFRFSWGITALLAWWSKSSTLRNVQTKRHDSIVPAGGNQRSGPSSLTPLASPMDEGLASLPFVGATNVPYPLQDNGSSYAVGPVEWNLISRALLMTAGGQSTMGCLVVGGILFKTIGWRIIVVTGSVYASLYLYERLTWTNKAKERLFKKQYVQHATRKFKMIVDLISANCSHQVQQELSGTFAKLCNLVDVNTSKMDEQREALEKLLHVLEKAAKEAKVLKNKANYLSHELDMFEDAYLKIYQHHGHHGH